MSLFNAILPVITLLLGFGSNYAVERHRDRQTERLDRQRRAADRQERATQEEIVFERTGCWNFMALSVGSFTASMR